MRDNLRMPIIKASEKKQFIVKSNNLIEARYRLTLQESHIILWLLTQIKPEDEDFKLHKMDISEFSKMVQVDSGNRYSELRKITKRLMQRIIEVYSPDEDKTIQVAWLSSAEYQHKKGYVSLEFSPKLKPYLLQLKNHFTKIDLVDTLKLKSIYSIRVFEILLQYASLGNRKLSLEEFRDYCGVKKNEYLLYADLKRKIIEKSKIEINSKTDYEVDYTEIKESRKVTALEWTIKKKDPQKEEHSQKLITLQKELRSELALIEALMEYGFSKGIAKRLLKTNEAEVIKNALKSVNLQIERNHVKNAKAMLQTAIKEKWHPEVFKKKKNSP
jgi:plasmid replication initiation protein